MAVNKVALNDEIVIDLTGDTVTPETLDVGITAHDASGNAIAGTRAIPDDRVIEHGTSLQSDGNGTWHWRKWESGIAECWVTLTFSRAVSDAWGTAYEAPETCVAYFPVSFVEVPVCLIDNCSTSGTATMSIERESVTTASAQFRPIRPNTAPSRAWRFGVYAVGRYK